MRKLTLSVLVFFLAAIIPSGVFAQANSSSVGGVVQDTTQALIPGVLVTLTNTETGVVDTRLTNDSGTYNFPSVPAGIYKISGELTGFTPDIQNGLQVGASNQIRVNLVLRVGGAPATSVTINSAQDNAQLRETSSSIG